MRYYSILDLFSFFKFQKEFDYRGIDIILKILESGRPDDERREEIDIIFENSGLIDFMNLYEMEEIDFSDVSLREHVDMTEEEFKNQPIVEYRIDFILDDIRFTLWLN